MPSNPYIDNEDQFIVGKKSDNKTYKTTFDGLKHDIGLNIGEAPTDPINGSIWVDINSGQCPPPVYIWAEGCNPDTGGGIWEPIGGGDRDEDFLQYDANKNVYVPGNLYISGELLVDQGIHSPGSDPSNTIEIDVAGNVFITGDVYVNSNITLNGNTFENDTYADAGPQLFDGIENVLYDNTNSITVEGNLVVGGIIVVQHTITKNLYRLS